MGKKEKDKDKKKESKKDSKKKSKKLRKLLQKTLGIVENPKAECCEKYKKSEEKRCTRCPMFDLLKKIEKLKKEAAP
jgi:hypothetical protein